MFKERISQVYKDLRLTLRVALAVVIFMGFCYVVKLSVSEHTAELIGTVTMWTAVIFLGIVCLGFSLLVLHQVYAGIKWLFIEPYQNYRKSKDKEGIR